MFVTKLLKDCCLDSWSYIFSMLGSEQSNAVRRKTAELKKQNQYLEQEIADCDKLVGSYQQVNSEYEKVFQEYQAHAKKNKINIACGEGRPAVIESNRPQSNDTQGLNTENTPLRFITQQQNRDEELAAHQQFLAFCHDDVEQKTRHLSHLKKNKSM